jgi:hypothetical protein
MYTVCERFLPALAMRRDEEIILLCPTVLFLSSPHTAAKKCYLQQPTRTAAKNGTYTHAVCCKKMILTSTRAAAKNGTYKHIASKNCAYIYAHCCKKCYLQPRGSCSKNNFSLQPSTEKRKVFVSITKYPCQVLNLLYGKKVVNKFFPTHTLVQKVGIFSSSHELLQKIGYI